MTTYNFALAIDYTATSLVLLGICLVLVILTFVLWRVVERSLNELEPKLWELRDLYQKTSDLKHIYDRVTELKK